MSANEKIPPESVHCQLEQHSMRGQGACHPSECETCGWNLDNQERKRKTAAMRYHKKPVEVEAFRWIGDHGRQEGPEWFTQAVAEHKVYFKNRGTSGVRLCINTLEGLMSASVGDFIIRGVKGEIYPCKPDIFFQTYELADKGSPTLRSGEGDR